MALPDVGLKNKANPCFTSLLFLPFYYDACNMFEMHRTDNRKADQSGLQADGLAINKENGAQVFSHIQASSL